MLIERTLWPVHAGVATTFANGAFLNPIISNVSFTPSEVEWGQTQPSYPFDSYVCEQLHGTCMSGCGTMGETLWCHAHSNTATAAALGRVVAAGQLARQATAARQGCRGGLASSRVFGAGWRQV
jgi:hypothetical protein